MIRSPSGASRGSLPKRFKTVWIAAFAERDRGGESDFCVGVPERLSERMKDFSLFVAGQETGCDCPILRL